MGERQPASSSAPPDAVTAAAAAKESSRAASSSITQAPKGQPNKMDEPELNIEEKAQRQYELVEALVGRMQRISAKSTERLQGCRDDRDCWTEKCSHDISTIEDDIRAEMGRTKKRHKSKFLPSDGGSPTVTWRHARETDKGKQLELLCTAAASNVQRLRGGALLPAERAASRPLGRSAACRGVLALLKSVHACTQFFGAAEARVAFEPSLGQVAVRASSACCCSATRAVEMRTLLKCALAYLTWKFSVL